MAGASKTLPPSTFFPPYVMKASRSAFYILGLCCTAYILSMFHRVCPAVISLDLTRDFGLDNSTLGMLSGATFLSYGLMQLPSGLLADKLGGRRSLCLLLLFAGGCAIGFSFSSSSSSLISFRLLQGIGLAVTVPSMVILAGIFPAQAYARVTSVLLCCGGMGSILAAQPLAFGSSLLGWRTCIAAAGVLTLALTAAIWFGIKDAPAAAKADKPRSSIRQDIALIMKTRTFWLVAAWGMTIMGPYFTLFSLWWGPYLMNGCGLDKADASTIMTIGALFALLTQPIGGWLSDSVFHRRKALMVTGSLIGVAAALIMVLKQGFDGTEAIMLMIVFVFGTVMFSPLNFAVLRESVPLRLIGTATGLVNMLPPLWSVVMQKAYGWFLDLGGGSSPEAFRLASWVILVNLVAALIVSLMLKETYGQRVD